MKIPLKLTSEELHNILRSVITGARVSGGRRYSFITDNSLEVTQGCVFVAVRGVKIDSNAFIGGAVADGATCIISDQPMRHDLPVDQITVTSSRAALAMLAAAAFGNPASNLRVLGVTGTSGKSTTAHLLKTVLEAAGEKTACIGTIYNYDGVMSYKSDLTTPTPLYINSFFSKAVANGCRWAVMEVSSHALDQERVAGIRFSGAVFTNLSHEHIDYHKTMENYARAKSKLFEALGGGAVAVINADDPYGDYMAGRCTSNKILMYGRNEVGNNFRILKEDRTGQVLQVTALGASFEVKTSLIGVHNAYNILAASVMALALGIDAGVIAGSIEGVKFIPGRLQSMDFGQDFGVFVDYAHKPRALEVVLDTLRRLTKGRLIVVFGCGGDRDREKRPMMGRIASELADYVIVTSDNPRSEEPKAIIDEILKGVKGSHHEVIDDRYLAIERAIESASTGDTVLVAGKGHEDYQIVGKCVYHFDDREVCYEILRNSMLRKLSVQP